jgi:hypothetical protein
MKICENLGDTSLFGVANVENDRMLFFGIQQQFLRWK